MLILLGSNHRSAPVEVREKLAFSEDQLPDILGRLHRRPGVRDAMILSTCNRVELLIRTEGAASDGLQGLLEFLREERDVSRSLLDGHTYHLHGREVVQHLFEVAAGLDSMILGEPQILGQVKQAYRVAKAQRVIGPVVERLMQQCLATAKRVRSETGIARHAVSVAFAAVELGRRIFGDLAGRRGLLLGAGKMTDLVARHLVSNGVEDLVVTSRTYNHAVAAAERFSGRAVHWQEGLAQLDRVDIVVSCTGAPRPILGRDQVMAAMRTRRGQPLFIIDIAVPRDVDPGVNGLDDVYLYDIDALQGVVDANMEERQEAALQARRIITEDADSFARWRQAQQVTPTIVSLRETMLEIGRGELQRFRRRMGPLTPDQERALEELTRAVIQKILHRPILHLREAIEHREVHDFIETYRGIFGLDTPPGREPGSNKREGSPGSGPRRLLRGGLRDGRRDGKED